jgi:dynein heavy chain
MKDYHEKSVKVQPLVQKNLQMEGELKVAKAKLRQAQTDLAKVNAKIKSLQDSFQKEMKNKNDLDEQARQTKKTMDQAQRLISSLSGERKRWAHQKSTITERKKRLVGDVSLCCAFLSYCGAFNSEFRQILISQCFTGDMKKRGIPVTTGLDIVSFLVDDTVVGEWSL